MNPSDRLIIALDRTSRDEILHLVDRLSGVAGLFKIGLQAFIANGPSLVSEIIDRGEKVFLDLKIHDIPNTARNAVEQAACLGVSIATVHVSGGTAMLQSCAEAAAALPRMLLAGVTVLTSLDDAAVAEIGFREDSRATVVRLATLARNAGVRGIVTSPIEISALRDALGDAITIITPGVRSSADPAHDQRRTLSARMAVARGADYLVVGRPITGHPDPRAAALAFVDEIAS